MVEIEVGSRLINKLNSVATRLFSSTVIALLCVSPLYGQTGQNLAAEIISKEGSGEWRADAQGEWATASISQQLVEGTNVRTGSRSKLGLLFRDQSQMRLNQNSVLIVRSVLDEQGSSTRFELNRGRAWVQSKRIPDSLIIETPSAVAAIRGTDWDIEVGVDGSTLLTVLHGAVELSNAFGSVTVTRNEQGVASVGAAPFILQIRNPESRVQWVMQYQLRPLFYLLTPIQTLAPQNRQIIELLAAGDLVAAQQNVSSLDTNVAENQLMQAVTNIFAGELADAETVLQSLNTAQAMALLADIYLYAGESARAIDLMGESPLLPQYPELASLLAQAYFMQDETERANEVISENLQLFPESVHLLLARGEISIFSGDASLAIETFQQVLAIEPDNDRAFYGLGRVYGEREFVSEALANLNAAIGFNVSDASYLAEKATVETFANNLSAAEMSLQQALDLQPANAIAFVGRGVLLLKQGKPEAAIQEFLKASLLEPKFARVQMYLAIAYYQQGQPQLALSTLALAKEIDDKDPLPYFLESTIRKEQFQPSAAMLASHNAMDRLPNLKSLNQVVIDQKGNTNLGSALAIYGLTDWAQKIAVDSYNPFWAGSSLFLSNQTSNNEYVSLSEKFKGFMTNPLAFGAPNRFSSLVTTPGNYAAISGIYSELDQDNFTSKLTVPAVSLSGMNNKYLPVSYFYSDNGYNIRSETRDKTSGLSFATELQPDIRTYGLGATPGDNLKLFYFSDEQSWQAGQDTSANNASGTNFSIVTNNNQRQQAVGVQYVFSPEEKLDFSYTKFEIGIDQNSDLSTYDDFDFPPNRFINESDNTTVTRLDNFMETFQVRYDRKFGNHFVSVGAANLVTENHLINDSSLMTRSEFYNEGVLTSSSVTDNTSLTVSDSVLDEKKYFLHYLYKAHEKYEIELDLTRSNFDVTGLSTTEDVTNGVTYTSPQQPFSFADNYFSAGFNYILNEDNNIRLVYQDYLHFNLANTLNSTTTAGIPFNTELLLTGSIQQRSRLQWENTFFKDTYFDIYFDVIDLENDFFSSRNVTLPTVSSGLSRIGQLSDWTENLFIDDYKSQWFSAGSVERGTFNTVGFDINRVVTDRIGMYLNYRQVDSTVTEGVNKGGEFLNVPLQKARIGLTWSSAFRTKLGLQVDYMDFAENTSANYLTFVRDGVYAKLSFVQEFRNRRLLAFSQVLYDATVVETTNTFSVGLELRL